jgi:hypothetical protein
MVGENLLNLTTQVFFGQIFLQCTGDQLQTTVVCAEVGLLILLI